MQIRVFSHQYDIVFLSFSLFHDPDEGHKDFLVEVFENQHRSFPGGDFKPPSEHNWTDAVIIKNRHLSTFCKEMQSSRV